MLCPSQAITSGGTGWPSAQLKLILITQEGVLFLPCIVNILFPLITKKHFKNMHAYILLLIKIPSWIHW